MRKSTRVATPDDEDEEAALDAASSDGFDLSSLLASDNENGDSDDSDDATAVTGAATRLRGVSRRGYRKIRNRKGARTVRGKLEEFHPELTTMWDDLEKMPPMKAGKAEQPKSISRILKPFQLEGLAWLKAMEVNTEWHGGLLGDEMGLGKTIQAVSLIMVWWPSIPFSPRRLIVVFPI